VGDNQLNEVKLSVLLRGQLCGYEDALSARLYTRSLSCKSIKGSVFVISKEDFIKAFKQNAKTWSTLLTMAKLNDTILHNSINYPEIKQQS
jgi:hypothetical protein